MSICHLICTLDLQPASCLCTAVDCYYVAAMGLGSVMCFSLKAGCWWDWCTDLLSLQQHKYVLSTSCTPKVCGLLQGSGFSVQRSVLKARTENEQCHCCAQSCLTWNRRSSAQRYKHSARARYHAACICQSYFASCQCAKLCCCLIAKLQYYC